MDTIKCEFCGEVMNQGICPNCKSTFRQEANEIVWTFPEHQEDKSKELPILNCFDEYTIEEMIRFVEIGESKIGERNTFLRHMLNSALHARGLEPVF